MMNRCMPPPDQLSCGSCLFGWAGVDPEPAIKRTADLIAVHENPLADFHRREKSSGFPLGERSF